MMGELTEWIQMTWLTFLAVKHSENGMPGYLKLSVVRGVMNGATPPVCGAAVFGESSFDLCPVCSLNGTLSLSSVS